MGNCDVNKRHQNFKRELRAYHDSINRRNRYNLPRIMGKLNMFEAIDDEKENDVESSYEIDRKIPNTGLTVLKRGDIYAIGDYDGKPLTEFKYQFVEGCLGEHDKIVRCVTDDGKIEDFSVETETIVEDAAGGGMSVGGAMQSAQPQTSGIGVNDVSVSDKGEKNDDYHEIDYSKVREQLQIPFLCGARVVDVQRRKKKNRKQKRRHYLSESVDLDNIEFEVNSDYITAKYNNDFAASCDFRLTSINGAYEEYSETINDFDENVLSMFRLPKVMIIENIYVDKKFRGLGLAKKMISFVIDIANNHGITQFLLRAYSDEDIPEEVLVRMYGNFGFIPVQRTDSDGIIMVKV